MCLRSRTFQLPYVYRLTRGLGALDIGAERDEDVKQVALRGVAMFMLPASPTILELLVSVNGIARVGFTRASVRETLATCSGNHIPHETS